MKTTQLIASNIMTNLLLGSVYTFISPVASSYARFSDIHSLTDFLKIPLQLPIVWLAGMGLAPSIITSFLKFIIEKPLLWLRFPPFWAMLVLIAVIVFIIFIRVSKRWQTLKYSYKYSVFLLLTLSLNVIFIDCFYLSMGV